MSSKPDLERIFAGRRTKRGGGPIAFWVQCPNANLGHANGDQHPSCAVYSDQHFHCFVCGVHGDAINAVMLMRGIGFGDALRFMREQYGYEHPKTGRQQRPKAATEKTTEVKARWWK